MSESSVLESLNTVVIVLSDQLRISYVNDAGLNLFATGQKQLISHPLSDFINERDSEIEALGKTLATGQNFSRSGVAITFRDGRSLKLDITVTNIVYNENPSLLLEAKPVATHTKILRENLQYAQHFAAQQLVRDLAHEIKNPLGGIRGAAQLLHSQLNNEQQEYTEVIVEQTERLKNLVDRLLGPNKLPQPALSNIHQSMEKIRSLVLAETQSDVQILRDYDPSIPAILADQDMLEQVLLNIIQNAVQAMTSANTESPSIRLVTRVERQITIQNKHYPLAAKISIIDNGPGISDIVKDTLFYPLVSTKSQGSGLGLSIARTLVHHHNGKIDVSREGAQTAFVIYLPITKQDSEL